MHYVLVGAIVCWKFITEAPVLGCVAGHSAWPLPWWRALLDSLTVEACCSRAALHAQQVLMVATHARFVDKQYQANNCPANWRGTNNCEGGTCYGEQKHFVCNRQRCPSKSKQTWSPDTHA
jgi:hypothetical protein